MKNSLRNIRTVLVILFYILLLATSAKGWEPPNLISDTLLIELPGDSSFLGRAGLSPIVVIDNRKAKGQIIGINQINRWFYILIDQYFVLKAPLSDVLSAYLASDSLELNLKIVIDDVSIWKDTKPIFGKGWMLNGYTRLVDNKGQTIRGLQWEFRIKKPRKKKTEEVIGQLLMDWMEVQKNALRENNNTDVVSPHRYRRQMLLWLDTIILEDGYIVDGRLSLDFPADQMKKYSRNTPGIYYRKSSLHESIAIGGKDQQWYFRLNSKWLTRMNVTGRVGFNSFNTAKFDYLDWWNIFMVNVGLTGSIEYRPCYLKGLFAGVGIHQNINLLPEVIPYFETGLLFTFGVVLP